MAYTTNPYLPRLRGKTANLVLNYGWSIRRAARHVSVQPSTVMRWVRELEKTNRVVVPTKSSRPHHHPRELAPSIVQAIVDERLRHNRCAEVVHHNLVARGVLVSLSSVKRTLARKQLIKRRSLWKKWHVYPPRPSVALPGDLVELDTIHDGPHTDRLYIYTLLDVYSRWSYAWPVMRISARASLEFVDAAQATAPFSFATLQSDHGPEFSKWLTKQLHSHGLVHRHSRVRTPNDNGHLERFNRTIQEECLDRVPRNLTRYRKAIREYLHYYNTERQHMGIDYQTPLQVLRRS